MILRRLAALILLFTVIAVMRPVLACATVEAHKGSQKSQISAAKIAKAQTKAQAPLNDASDFSDDSSGETPSPLEDGSEDSGHSDAGLEDLATLSYEFHCLQTGKSRFPVSDTVPTSLSVAPLLRPPATAA